MANITFNSYQDFAVQLALSYKSTPNVDRIMGRTYAENARQQHAKFLHYAMGHRPDQPLY